MRGKILYGMLGVGLTVATVLTGTYGISQRNIQIYEDALELQQQVDSLEIPQFHLEDYAVRCYDGNSDYVFTYEQGKAKYEKQTTVLGAYVGTAYEVEGEYQVIVPTVEKFHKLLSLMDTAAGVQSESFVFGETEYGDEEQIATIWHEALHAWQFTNYESQIIDSVRLAETESSNMSDLITKEVDNNSEIVALYQQEMNCLKQAVQAESIDDKKSYVLQYKKIEEQRRQLLSESVLTVEEYYEKVEGMAFYVESKVYELLKGTNAYEEYYLEPISEYSQGTHKYYSMGMAKCLLLDEMKKDWKQEYDYSTSLTECVYEVFEIGG